MSIFEAIKSFALNALSENLQSFGGVDEIRTWLIDQTGLEAEQVSSIISNVIANGDFSISGMTQMLQSELGAAGIEMNAETIKSKISEYISL